MGDWASCGFRNVNDLLGIFRHFYRGLKVPIPLYQCDEGEERLRWAISDEGGGMQRNLVMVATNLSR
jgi:hypothetical protein